MDKEVVVHIYNGLLLSHKKEQCMGLQRVGHNWERKRKDESVNTLFLVTTLPKV